MNDIGIVIVTCYRDLALFERCIRSIAEHGVVAADIKIIVIANDDISLVDKLVELTNPLSLNIDILHYSAVTEWTGHIGWDSQQYFKLAVAKLISTSWYLVLDSDSYITNFVDVTNIFDNGHAFCSWVESAEHHRQHLYNANLIWNNPQSNYSMSDSPPFVMHTATVKDLLLHVNKDWFNFDHKGQLYTFEFFLYYSYLIHTNTLDKLYVKKNYPLIRGIQR